MKTISALKRFVSWGSFLVRWIQVLKSSSHVRSSTHSNILQIDPPYVSTTGSYKSVVSEASEGDHVRLTHTRQSHLSLRRSFVSWARALDGKGDYSRRIDILVVVGAESGN